MSAAGTSYSNNKQLQMSGVSQYMDNDVFILQL